MGKFTPGMLPHHPNNRIKSNRHLDVFVDDTKYGITRDTITDFHPDDESPVIKDPIMRMQL